MAYIHGKKDGPGPEDLPNIRAVRENRHVIRAMVQQLTGNSPAARGGQGCCRAGTCEHGHGQEQSNTNGKSSIFLGSTSPRHTPRPVVRVTFNGRVLVIDDNSNRQLLFLGNIRRGPQGQRFVLATRENGYSAVVEDGIRETLADLDGVLLSDAFDADDLSDEVSTRLGLTITSESDPTDAQ